MKKPSLLFHSKSKLDILYIRNKIQIISSIPVLIKKRNGIHLIFTETLHHRKAKVILDNYLCFLPNKLYPKRTNVIKPSIETNIIENLELGLNFLEHKILVLLNKLFFEKNQILN